MMLVSPDEINAFSSRRKTLGIFVSTSEAMVDLTWLGLDRKLSPEKFCAIGKS
jgi:hypothetical protein